jgi:hypothetical protein
VMPGAGQQNRFVRFAEWLVDGADDYDRVYIESKGNQIDLYVGAWCLGPRAYQSTERETWGKYNDFCTRLGRFYFQDRRSARNAWLQSSMDERWLMIDARRTFWLEYEPGRVEPVEKRSAGRVVE